MSAWAGAVLLRTTQTCTDPVNSFIDPICEVRLLGSTFSTAAGEAVAAGIGALFGAAIAFLILRARERRRSHS